MGRILEAVKGARKIELALALVLIAVAMLVFMQQADSAALSDEARLERLLSQIEGSGEISVMLSGEEGGYKGCVVIAEGGNDMRVVLKIQRAVQAALDISCENIEIIASGG